MKCEQFAGHNSCRLYAQQLSVIYVNKRRAREGDNMAELRGHSMRRSIRRGRCRPWGFGNACNSHFPSPPVGICAFLPKFSQRIVPGTWCALPKTVRAVMMFYSTYNFCGISNKQARTTKVVLCHSANWNLDSMVRRAALSVGF